MSRSFRIGTRGSRLALLQAEHVARLLSERLLARAREAFELPLAAYQVSGELAMLEAAAELGWLDRRRAGLELLTAIARAGADVVITYLAADAAAWLAEGDPG